MGSSESISEGRRFSDVAIARVVCGRRLVRRARDFDASEGGMLLGLGSSSGRASGRV